MQEINSDLRRAAAKYMPGAVYLLHGEKLVPLNEAAHSIPLSPDAVLHAIVSRSDSTLPLQEIVINEHYALTGRCVEKDAWLLQLFPSDEAMRKQDKVSKAREIMLHVFSRIDSIATKQDEYDFILDNCAMAVERVTLCSLMVVDGAIARVVAARGFQDDVIGLEIALEDVFLSTATEGKLDRVVTINDLEEYMDSYHDEVKTEENNQLLKSTLSAPVYVDGRLYAILNFDSLQKNSFTSDDEELLDLVKSNIEIILANHQMHERILYMSQRDLLTGFYNRTYLREYIQNHVQDSFLIGAFDLNGLKKVNDRYGHAAGDELIRGFSEELPRYFPANTVFFRMGGDEFLCILPSVDEAEAWECVRRMREADTVSFSCGFALQKEGTNFEETAQQADEKMYQDKATFYLNHDRRRR